MPTLESISPDALFTMFKGEPGTRKSTCALSYPTPQYWFDFDRKMEALILPMKRWGINSKEINFDSYNDWQQAQNKLEQLQVNCPYKTIIVDSITSAGDATTSQVKKAKKGNRKEIGGIPVSGFEEFNAEANAFQEMIALLKDIHKYFKIHIIMIAHVIGQRKDDDANKSTHHSRIIVTGAEKISAKLASHMGEVYHFNVKPDINIDRGDGKYALITEHMGNDYARTSLPLPKEIVFNNEPLYDKWIKHAIQALKDEKPIIRTIPEPKPLNPITHWNPPVSERTVIEK